MKRVLHAGCGSHPLPPWFDQFGPWDEVRLDVEPVYKPHFVASITELLPFLAESFDAVSCSHVLEHVYAYQVPKVLKEFRRVLMPGCPLIIMVPDLEDLQVSDEVLYLTADGPVTSADLFYGLHWSIAQSVHMAHHTGFTAKILERVLTEAKFSQVEVKRMPVWNLLGVGVK